MESYRLAQESGPPDAQWVLAWDAATLTLTAPDGQRVLEAPPTAAHRLVELYELYAEGKISFAAPHGSLAFKKESAAVAAVRGLVEAGLVGDPEFCAELRRQSLRAIPLGSVMFVVGGGLYCWYASSGWLGHSWRTSGCGSGCGCVASQPSAKRTAKVESFGDSIHPLPGLN